MKKASGNALAMAMKRLEVQTEGEQAFADSASAASVGSSPRSVQGVAKGLSPAMEDPPAPKWDDSAFARVKLMCSYGGKILPRPHDNQLRYVGGETRIVVVNRNISYAELVAKLSKMFGAGVIVKYQLPSEDLDALVSVTSDEDLENMMEECDRLQACNRPSRLRLFLFPRKVDSQTSFSDLLDGNINREHWFVEALNGVSSALPRTRSETSSIVSEVPDYLSGLDSLEDWSISSHSRQHGGEKNHGNALLGSLLHGSGELTSAPGSPMNRSAITTTSPTSSAPSSVSSMPSGVVDAALQLPNQFIPQMEEPPPNTPVQQKLAGSDIQNGASGLRLQQSHLSDADMSKISDPSFVPDEHPVRISKIPQQEQAVEHPVTTLPVSSKVQLQPQEPLQRNTAIPDKYLHASNAPLLDDGFETREGSPKYNKMGFKPADEVKQELEIQKSEVIFRGGDRAVKRGSEERLGERTGDQMRKIDDQNLPRRQLVEPVIVSSQQSDGFDSGSETHRRDQNFVQPSESEIFAVKEMQGQERFYAQMGDLHIESDDSASTYATQPPTVQLQNFGHPPTFLKTQVAARMSPFQAPQSYPRVALVQQQVNTTTAMYPDAPPFRASNPVMPHYQRQTSDPIQHIPPGGRVTSPYREQPSIHAVPSRFRGAAPFGYQNPSDLKRVLVTAAGPSMQQSRSPLTAQYNEQIPYADTSNVHYIDTNAGYATYGQFPVPSNPEYGGLNPFLEDIPQSAEVPTQRVYQEIYVDPTQDPQGIIDGRMQGRKYIVRN